MPARGEQMAQNQYTDLNVLTQGKPQSCGREQYVSEEEREILKELRSIKARVRRLRSLTTRQHPVIESQPAPARPTVHESGVAELRERWDDAQSRLRRANLRKYRALGYDV
jgi:hypothetical protein